MLHYLNFWSDASNSISMNSWSMTPPSSAAVDQNLPPLNRSLLNHAFGIRQECQRTVVDRSERHNCNVLTVILVHNTLLESQFSRHCVPFLRPKIHNYLYFYSEVSSTIILLSCCQRVTTMRYISNGTYLEIILKRGILSFIFTLMWSRREGNFTPRTIF